MTNQLESLGIAVYDRHGTLRSLSNIMNDLREVYSKTQSEQQPLLTIEMDNETSVPRVFYKGEEITQKVNVSFDWDTDTDIMGGFSYAIEYYEKGTYPVVNRIDRRVKGHALD